MHPGRTVKRAITPKPIKKLKRAAHPIDNAVYSLERNLNTKRRGRAAAYRHGSCPVKHGSQAAMINCRNRLTCR
jgi:hypothetical protein